MFHWLLHITGIDDVSGYWYGFWSGIGSDITEFTTLGIIWHRLNCHVDGCYRIGLHHVMGTPYITCRKHHPDIPKHVSHNHIKSVFKKEK